MDFRGKKLMIKDWRVKINIRLHVQYVQAELALNSPQNKSIVPNGSIKVKDTRLENLIN